MHCHNYFVRESIFWKYLEHETLSSLCNLVDIQWKLNLVPLSSFKKGEKGERMKKKGEKERRDYLERRK